MKRSEQLFSLGWGSENKTMLNLQANSLGARFWVSVAVDNRLELRPLVDFSGFDPRSGVTD